MKLGIEILTQIELCSGNPAVYKQTDGRTNPVQGESSTPQLSLLGDTMMTQYTYGNHFVIRSRLAW